MTLSALASAVESMADTLMGITFGNTFSGMTCKEAESIATVFAVAGRLDAAAHVVMMHGESDDARVDDHHDVYEALRQDGGCFSHTEDDAPFRLAMAHVRELF